MKQGDITTQNAAVILPTSAVGNFSIDMSTASGTQDVTTVGFTPSAVIFLATGDGVGRTSWGVDNGSGAQCVLDWHTTIPNGFARFGADSIAAGTASGSTYTGEISAFLSNGFTINWTRTGTPTGTLQVIYLAFK
jgi:hypothetical protein